MPTHVTVTYNIRHIPPMTPVASFTTFTINLSGSSCQRCTRSSRSSSLDLCAKRAGGGSSSLQTYQDLGTGTVAFWHLYLDFFLASRKRWAC